MKCMVKGFFKNSEETINYGTLAIFQKEKRILTWKEQKPKETTISIDFNTKSLTRENKELKMLLTFDPNQDKIMNCKLKEIDISFDMEVKIITYFESETFLKLTYETYLEKEKVDTFFLEINILENKV